MKITKLLLLAIPLTALAIISFMIENWWGISNGFFLNMATELFGILITITYVDWVLKKNKEDEWKEVRELVKYKTQQLLQSTIYIFEKNIPSELKKRGGFSISVKLGEGYDIDDLIRNSPKRKIALLLTSYILGGKATDKLIAKYVAEEDYRRLPQQSKEFIESLQGNSWKEFYKDIQSIVKETENLIDLFGNRISSRQFKYILECQVSARQTLELLKNYGDVITGVTNCEAIGQKPEFASELKQGLSVLLANLYRGLIDLGYDLNGKKTIRKKENDKL